MNQSREEEIARAYVLSESGKCLTPRDAKERVLKDFTRNIDYLYSPNEVEFDLAVARFISSPKFRDIEVSIKEFKECYLKWSEEALQITT